MSDAQTPGIAEARLAVSPHNTQPWRFTREGDATVIGWEADRELPAGDPQRRYLMTAMGAVTESMVIGAAASGFASHVSVDIDRPTRRAAVCEFAAGTGAASDVALAAAIPARQTNRKPYARTPLPADAAMTMSREAASHECELRFLSDDNARQKVGRLLTKATALNFRERAVFHEFCGWLRMDRSDPRYGVDGLTLDTLEFGRFGSLGAPLAMKPSSMRVLSALRLDLVLAMTQGALARRSGAIGLITAPGSDLAAAFAAGRALTRAWLTAARFGLSVHPITAMLDHHETRDGLSQVFGLPSSAAIAVSFRIGYGPTAHRAPRRPLTELTQGLSEEGRPHVHG